MALSRSFFKHDVVTVAKELLGCHFVRKTAKGNMGVKIVETEAYSDATDLASHARFGRTERNAVMFGPAGVLYVYIIYGIYNLTNIVCGQEGKAGAVLIRSAEIMEGKKIAQANIENSKFTKLNERLATGPGKFSLAFGLDRSWTGTDITTSADIYITAKMIQRFDIIESPRVGVGYAKYSACLPWRFYIKNNPYVSK